MEAITMGKPPPSRARALAIEHRLGIHRREQLRIMAEAALLYSPQSRAVQAFLSPEWGDIRKDDWQQIAIAMLEASGALAEKLTTAEGRLDAISLVLEEPC